MYCIILRSTVERMSDARIVLVGFFRTKIEDNRSLTIASERLTFQIE